jgi:hypothetical protein
VSRFRQLLSLVLADPNAEQVRRSHEDAIRELQQMRFAGAVIVSGVQLVDTVPTIVSHNLGRRPAFVRESVVRGAVATGRIVEARTDAALDYTKQLVLTATGWGATVTVDLLVL